MNDIVYSVKQLNNLVKNTLLSEPRFNRITVEGEVSNLRNKTSNHIYFSIKDEESTLPCMIGSWNKHNINFELLENGAKLRLTGKLQVYVPYGKYTFLISDIKPAGQGDLFVAFEMLKKKLQEEGLFDEIHKKNLPAFPKKIAIIISKDGDAAKDIISGITKKNTYVDILLFPSKVQGEGAAENIREMISLANTMEDIDLIIVGRGGGSIEDLWAFNEEITVRSIFESNIPVISAVGHENDHTISDWVADVRAKTPTEAGEIAVPGIGEIREDMEFIRASMTTALESLISSMMRDVDEKNPARNKNALYERIERSRFECRDIVNRMKMFMHEKINDHARTMVSLMDRMDISSIIREKEYKLEIRRRDISMENILKTLESKLAIQEIRLNSANPLQLMEKGYIVATDGDGKIQRTVDNLNKGDDITLKFIDGTADAKIMNTTKERD